MTSTTAPNPAAAAADPAFSAPRARFLRFAFCLVLAWCGARARALADAERWLFVPQIAPHAQLPAFLPNAVDALSRAAGAHGIAVLDNGRAALQLEQESVAPEAIGQDDVRTLQRLAEYALRSLAAQDTRTALEQLEGAQRMVARAPEAYGQVAPRLVLDLCLYRARALLESGAPRDVVREDVRTCRARIPLEIEPEMLKHTNVSVRQLLADATADLLREPGGRIDVRGPEGCLVRIDGIDAGSVREGRFSSRVLQGEHRVSLVCQGVSSRSHLVLARSSPVALTIVPKLDDALRTSGRLWLVSGDAEAFGVGAALGRALGGVRVLIVRMAGDGTVQVADGVGPSVTLPHPSHAEPAWPEVSTAAAIEVLKGTPRSAPAPQSAPSTPSASTVSASPHHVFGEHGAVTARRAQRGLAVGAAALAMASTALHARAVRRRDGLSDSAYAALEERRALGYGIGRLDFASALTGASASLAASTALSLWLASRADVARPTRWPALGLTAAGITVGALGLWQLNASEHVCESCSVEGASRRALGGLLVNAGTALLAAPLFHALFVHWPLRAGARRAARSELSLGVGASALQLTWSH